jgi:hypothetical protein
VRRARLDPALRVRVTSTRELHYRDAAIPGEDRPPHVRAASGIAMVGGRLAVVQDDASFIALVGPGGAMSIALPRGRAGRRRFEDALGNKADKLDLESCIVIAGELWAFGSGSTETRERVARVGDEVRLYDAAPLYAHLRRAIGSKINIEGVASLGDELWLFHRGNTGTGDAGPAVVRFAREPVFAAILTETGIFPAPLGCDRYDLGEVAGTRLGFTDAIAGDRRVFYLAAAESAPNAIDDGPVAGSQLGVIDGDSVRAAPLALDGKPIKAEGLAFDPHDPRKGWIVIDPDDTEIAAPLIAFELDGPW